MSFTIALPIVLGFTIVFTIVEKCIAKVHCCFSNSEMNDIDTTLVPVGLTFGHDEYLYVTIREALLRLKIATKRMGWGWSSWSSSTSDAGSGATRKNSRPLETLMERREEKLYNKPWLCFGRNRDLVPDLFFSFRTVGLVCWEGGLLSSRQNKYEGILICSICSSLF